MLYHYSVYGLSLESDIELWPFIAASKTIKSLNKDKAVVITSGGVPKIRFDGTTTGMTYCKAEPDLIWLRIPGIARYLIQEGQKITYELECDDEERSLLDTSLFIQSHCIPYILTQLNYLVIRASAVRVHNKAVLFAGQTQSGKSTYAAALHNRDFDVACDDFCVIDDNNRVLPGYPYLKIWADIVAYLRHKPATFEAVRPNVDKYFYPLEDGFCNTPLAVDAIYLLNQSETAQWQTEAITGLKKIAELESVVYRPAVRSALELPALTPKILALASTAKVSKVVWPNPLKVTGKKPRIADQLQYFLDDAHD